MVEFERTVTIPAPREQVWALTNDLEAVASCIPGVSEFHQSSPEEFECRLTQKVGSVRANFVLNNRLTIIEQGRHFALISEGRDKALNSTVKAQQTFELIDRGDETEALIKAHIRFTGTIATFGGQIIQVKAEQVTMEAVNNVSNLLRGGMDASDGR
jgi:carbon monoxide dehydrogenase subunit G